MPDNDVWIRAVRGSHERFTALVAGLTDEQILEMSYASEWSIATVASHLGSQAEIFGLLLDAGLKGEDPPGGEVFPAIWARWDALPPREQIAQSRAVNEEFVSRLEQLTPAQRESFTLPFFGSVLDLTQLAAMRLGEHSVHTWDVAVVLDGAAEVAPDAVELLIGPLGTTAARVGKPATDGGEPIAVVTSAPEGSFLITLQPEVTLVAQELPDPSAALQLPAEALVRLVYGRLDPEHTPAGVVRDERLDRLRAVFVGF